MLLTHIAIALASLVVATYALVSPSRSTLRLSYGLVAATLASGTYLTFMNPTHLAQTCLTGLVYLSVVTFALIAARRKLVANLASV